jgi:hypothetical protein
MSIVGPRRTPRYCFPELTYLPGLLQLRRRKATRTENCFAGTQKNKFGPVLDVWLGEGLSISSFLSGASRANEKLRHRQSHTRDNARKVHFLIFPVHATLHPSLPQRQRPRSWRSLQMGTNIRIRRAAKKTAAADTFLDLIIRPFRGRRGRPGRARRAEEGRKKLFVLQLVNGARRCKSSVSSFQSDGGRPHLRACVCFAHCNGKRKLSPPVGRGEGGGRAAEWRMYLPRSGFCHASAVTPFSRGTHRLHGKKRQKQKHKIRFPVLVAALPRFPAEELPQGRGDAASGNNNNDCTRMDQSLFAGAASQALYLPTAFRACASHEW